MSAAEVDLGPAHEARRASPGGSMISTCLRQSKAVLSHVFSNENGYLDLFGTLPCTCS